MKKIIILGVIAIPYFLYSMDAPKDRQIVPKSRYFRPINPEVEKRHDVKKWHERLVDAVIFPHLNNQVTLLLSEAGNDATELVCTAHSTYGPILRAAYIENPGMKNVLKKHMDEAYFKQCFELEKSRLHNVWRYPNTISPAAESLVRDFHTQDPIKYPLSPEECEKLGIK